MINRHWCIQGTIYRNSQLRYTHIMYCIMWEECKQTQCPHRSWRERTTALMWYYSPTKDKLIYQVRVNTYDFWLSGLYNCDILLFHPWTFYLKNNALPLNSLFWSPPTAVHRFDAWYMAVPGLYISWWDLVESGIKGTFSINLNFNVFFSFLVTILAFNCYLSQAHVSCHKIFGHKLFAVLTFNGYKQTPKQKCLCVKCLQNHRN